MGGGGGVSANLFGEIFVWKYFGDDHLGNSDFLRERAIGWAENFVFFSL